MFTVGLRDIASSVKALHFPSPGAAPSPTSTELPSPLALQRHPDNTLPSFCDFYNILLLIKTTCTAHCILTIVKLLLPYRVFSNFRAS